MARVLVVDDDSSVATAIRTFLQYEGLEVVLADGGCSALDIIEITGIDVIIVDIYMPGMDGFQVIRAFQQRAPTIPIIAMSGYLFRDSPTSTPDLLAKAAELGATRCLQKPFRPSELMAAVDACLGGSTRPSADAHPVVSIR
jgi:CheY-like chemotaxis protein